MTRRRTFAIAVACAVVIACAVGLVIAVSPAAAPEQNNDATSKRIQKETENYSIDITYPEFAYAPANVAISDTVGEMIDRFEAYPANPRDSAVPQNQLLGSFNSVYVGPEIISVELLISEYTGGAHPNTDIIGINIDKKTGGDVTLDDALRMTGLSLGQVSERASSQLKQALGDAFFPEGAEAKPENYATFLIDDKSVSFIFQDYQVAPHSSGPQRVSIPRVH